MRKKGIVYHRDGLNGDYDDFDDVESLMSFILTGVDKFRIILRICLLDGVRYK